MGSEDHFLQVAEELVGKLPLVGLYRIVESMTKQTLRHRFPESKVKKCYKVDQLKKVFTDELGTELTTVKDFAAVDEIRDLNNKVKHGGKLPEPALKSYERLVDAVVPYLHGVAIVVIP